MNPWLIAIALWFVLCWLPGCLWVWFVWRAPPRRSSWFVLWGTFLLGAGGGAATTFAVAKLAQAAGIAQSVSTFGDLTGLLYVLVFAGPFGEATKVAAAWPAFRSRHFDEEFDGILFSIAAATGFALGQSLLFFLQISLGVGSVMRVLMLVVAHTLVSPLWGYHLGKVRRTRTPTTRFIVAWVAAALMYALMLHTATATSVLALVAAVPVLLGLAFVTWWSSRDLLTRFGRLSRISIHTVFPSLPSPSIHTLRQALSHAEGTLQFRWIIVGAFSTTGVALTMIAIAVWIGHQVGLDFSAIGVDDTSAQTIAPLGLITVAVLVAFPISGYLIAKASRAQGVLEPALSSILAIVVGLVLLGLAAPVAMVFAFAFAPIAFGFACVGAWFGLGK